MYFIIIFKDKFHINIVCDANLKIVIFLDMTLILANGKCNPYNKPKISTLASILVFMCQVLVVVNEEEETFGSTVHIAIIFPPISSESF